MLWMLGIFKRSSIVVRLLGKTFTFLAFGEHFCLDRHHSLRKIIAMYLLFLVFYSAKNSIAQEECLATSPNR